MMSKRNIVLVAIVLLLTGCGPFTSGTWEDSSKNWERAFGEAKPKDVEVVHSKYWRSPHWTYECEYFFQIRSNESLKKQIFSNSAMVTCTDVQDKNEIGFGDKPAWFLPKPLDMYEAWTYKDDPTGNFRLFIDKETGDMFLADFQV